MSNLSVPENINSVLNSSIEIKSTRISHKVAVPHQVCFRLDAQLLEHIAQCQGNQTKLALSVNNLANLRHYALFNLASEQSTTLAQTCLTFSTEYSLAHNRAATPLFRSVINSEGKISQHIQQELAQNPLLLKQISQAHYWLIAEILAQLPLKSKPWYAWCLTSCLAIALVIISMAIWYLIPLSHLPKLLCLAVLILSSSVLSLLIAKRLRSWIIYHLLEGLLVKSITRRKLGLKALSFFA